jgi:nucleotide-binding universal stress UspA family protein
MTIAIDNQTPNDSNPKRTIFVAVDESEYSEHIVSWAIENIIDPATDLVVLLNARPVLGEFQPYVGPTPDYAALIKKLDADHIQTSTNLLNKLGKRFKTRNIETKAISISGDPKEALLQKTIEMKPTMLVVGSRGMGPISRGLLGSVSNYLVHHSHVPVFVVRKHLK